VFERHPFASFAIHLLFVVQRPSPLRHLFGEMCGNASACSTVSLIKSTGGFVVEFVGLL
jgi:hypothetical protein